MPDNSGRCLTARATHEPNPQAVSAVPVGIANAEPLFPFTLHCNDQGWSSHAFRGLFMARKPERLSWYGYDVIILSRDEVEFVAYGMQDACFGGLGDEVGRFKTKAPRMLTREPTKNRAYQIALLARQEEIERAERDIVQAYAEAIFAAQGMSAGTAETAQQAQAEGRQPGGEAMRPNDGRADKEKGAGQ